MCVRWKCVFSTLKEANVQSKVMQIAMTAECFFLTQMLYAARNLNAPFPFSFTRIEWVNCFLKERSCVEQNETGEQSLAEFRVCQPADVDIVDIVSD